MPNVTIVLDHAPMVLRIDDMTRGPDGFQVARQVDEIPLSRGCNSVDADLWRRWLDQNKDGPLVTGKIVAEQKQESNSDGETVSSASGNDGRSGGSRSVESEIRDRGVQDADAHRDPIV